MALVHLVADSQTSQMHGIECGNSFRSDLEGERLGNDPSCPACLRILGVHLSSPPRDARVHCNGKFFPLGQSG